MVFKITLIGCSLVFCLAGRVRRGLRGVEGRVFGAEGGREGWCNGFSMSQPNVGPVVCAFFNSRVGNFVPLHICNNKVLLNKTN